MTKTKKPIVLCIMDGWGLAKPHQGNAVWLAKTPNMDRLSQLYPTTTLQASGTAVGLPPGQMGNSEVGHMNIGAGRVVYTGLSLINKDIEERTFPTKPELLNVFAEVKKRNARLHIFGLMSQGGVHSHLDHLLNLMDAAFDQQIPYVLHCFTDGRDVSPKASVQDMKTVVSKLAATNGKLGVIAGRYYAMDRDRRWERTETVYHAMVANQCERRYDDPITYIQQSHANNITDEFILPALPHDYAGYQIQDHDVVFSFNFRPDRARQICHLLKGSEELYDHTPTIKRANLFLATMMQYEKIVIDQVIYPPFSINNTLGEIIARHDLSQLRIAETEKYAHVTFFIDGGKEVVLNKCDRVLMPSQKVATYDLKPAMSAHDIMDSLLPRLANYDVVILNFANPDMVGHTGVISATVKAVETTDYCVGQLVRTVNLLGGITIITADHGNAEVKLDANNKPVTSHSSNPVPLIVTSNDYELSHGALCDVAPTILGLLGITPPSDMTGKNLLTPKQQF